MWGLGMLSDWLAKACLGNGIMFCVEHETATGHNSSCTWSFCTSKVPLDAFRYKGSSNVNTEVNNPVNREIWGCKGLKSLKC